MVLPWAMVKTRAMEEKMRSCMGSSIPTCATSCEWFGLNNNDRVGSSSPTSATTMTAFTLCLRFASMD
jgi:hypothetical protein